MDLQERTNLMINPMLNNLGELMKNFNNFAQQFQTQNRNVTPQQKVQELLNSGQMTQQDFDQLRDIANKITGRNY